MTNEHKASDAAIERARELREQAQDWYDKLPPERQRAFREHQKTPIESGRGYFFDGKFVPLHVTGYEEEKRDDDRQRARDMQEALR